MAFLLRCVIGCMLGVMEWVSDVVDFIKGIEERAVQGCNGG